MKSHIITMIVIIFAFLFSFVLSPLMPWLTLVFCLLSYRIIKGGIDETLNPYDKRGE